MNFLNQIVTAGNFLDVLLYFLRHNEVGCTQKTKNMIWENPPKMLVILLP